VKDTKSGAAIAYSAQRPLRLAYFVTHPIQYQAPLLKRIAQEPDIALKVFFGSNLSLRGQVDAEFGVQVKWDTPLLEGYEHEFLPVLRDVRDRESPGFARPGNYGVGRRLRESKFDAVWVHGYNYLTNLQAIRTAKSMGIPVLLRSDSTLHDRARSGIKLAVKRMFFNWLKERVSAVLSVGDENSAYWRHYFGESMPVFPLYYAVDNELFQRECAAAAETRDEFRQSLGLEAGRAVILFAAKLIARKRCGELVEAYLKLAAESTWPVPCLLIVGDGEERAMLEARAKSAGVGDVRFVGFRNQSELPRFYDLCDVFVLASVDEPWGLAINEVMNAGRPVIVSDQVGCWRNLVRPEANGFVVRAGDVEELAESLRTVFADPDRARAMGAESLRIVNGFSFEQNVQGLRAALGVVAPGFGE
jgi:glycosyltransferase involved in cell wall biosynthesis